MVDISEVDGTGSGSCSVSDSDISRVESLGSSSIDFVTSPDNNS
jgi:hypothetical protein